MHPVKRKVFALAFPLISRYFMDINNILKSFLENYEDSDSDSDSENENSAFQSLPLMKYQPLRQEDYIERVVANYSNVEFQQAFRLTRESYEFLLVKLSNNIDLFSVGRPQTDLNNQLLAVIWLLATPDSYRSVGEKFGYSKSTLSKFFFRIVRALNMLSSTIIKWPAESDIKNKINIFGQKSPFKNMIGAIDGTYVPISPPEDQAIWYRNRNKFHSITLQAICDSEMSFMDCSVGYPSSVHDARIFKKSLFYEKAISNPEKYFPNNAVILGDKAYPLMKWCITPFKDRGKLNEQQKLFNSRHSGTRNIIERSFALLFGRFRRLQMLSMKCCDWYSHTVLACCVLHNICLMHPDEFIEDYVRNGKDRSAQSSSELVFVNDDDDDDDILQGEVVRNFMLLIFLIFYVLINN